MYWVRSRKVFKAMSRWYGAATRSRIWEDECLQADSVYGKESK